MAVRRFTRPSHRSGVKTKKDWSASAPETSTTAVPASSAQLLQTFTPIVGGETVLRTRGLISIASDQEAFDELQIGAYGIGVVTEQAASIGITAIPHPNTDAAWGGWLYHTYYSYQYRSLTAVGAMADFAHQIVVDSKAMRIVRDDERLVMVIENSAAFGIEVFNSFRILSKVN